MGLSLSMLETEDVPVGIHLCAEPSWICSGRLAQSIDDVSTVRHRALLDCCDACDEVRTGIV